MEKMLVNIHIPEERRLLILSGLSKGYSLIDIAAEIGVRKSIVSSDLKAMKYNRDPELKQVYLDKETRINARKQSRINLRDARFRHMTGMTFQEKNFENMVAYYKPELIKILGSDDENAAIMELPRSVQKTLARYDITYGLRNKRRISSKARDCLPLRGLGG